MPTTPTKWCTWQKFDRRPIAAAYVLVIGLTGAGGQLVYSGRSRWDRHARFFNRADNELRRPLGSQSSAHPGRLDVEENSPSRDLGDENPNLGQDSDYEYDEAHDVLAGPLAGSPAPHRVTPAPEVKLGEGGDYGYDEAHDFGAPT